jgi:alkanesulfonate monooxygenase SsuD/methylene tetrahydromethanopterin reductase-like flavin-dependent oxidoreductase (luciferase family)
MKFGVFDHMDRSGPDLGQLYQNRLALVEAYDRAGFYGYHVAEHHGTPLGLSPSPSVFLSAVAQRTDRLRFGPMVYVLSTYHPLRILEEICMLDQLSGGRLEVGIGRGISPIELAFYGITDESEARQRYEETLSLLLESGKGGPITHSGEYFSVESFPMELHPVQKPFPPLWFGIARPATADWAAEHRINGACNGPATAVRSITDQYRAAWHRLGRDPEHLPLLGMSRHIVVTDSDAEAYEETRVAYDQWFANLNLLWTQRGVRIPLNFPSDFDDAVNVGFCVVGSPSTVRDRLLPQVEEAGINYLLGRLAFGSLPVERSLRSVELLEAEVLPALAGAGTLRSG